jgi:hypothetical protein
MRDDRIGGLPTTSAHWAQVVQKEADFDASLNEKAWAKANFAVALDTWSKGVVPHLSDAVQASRVGSTVRYGALLYEVIDAAWRAMGVGFKKSHNMSFDPGALNAAIVDYDAAFTAYRAYGLSDVFAPSLYHPYYLCLGTKCSCAFDPIDAGDSGHGIGATIDALRGDSV